MKYTIIIATLAALARAEEPNAEAAAAAAAPTFAREEP
jgi:hypothetical protein